MRPRVAFGLAAALALVALLVAFAGPAAVARALARADPGLTVAAVAAYALFFLLRGVRWHLLLGPGASGPGTATALTASGWLVSTVAPLKAGDVMRAAWMARRHRVGFGAVAGTVAIERTLDVLGLALAASAALLAVHLAGVAVPALLQDLVAIAWLVPLAAAAFLLALAWAVPAPQGRGLVARLLRVVRQALDQMPALARRPRVLVPVLALTVACIVAQCLVYAFLVAAVVPTASADATAPADASGAGTAASVLWIALAGAPLFLLSFALAFTPAHLGTYEAAFVLVYAGLGLADASTLLPAALAVHLLTASIVALLGGVSFAALAGGPGSAASVRDPAAEARP